MEQKINLIRLEKLYTSISKVYTSILKWIKIYQSFKKFKDYKHINPLVLLF